jgi:hypothetical protein
VFSQKPILISYEWDSVSVEEVGRMMLTQRQSCEKGGGKELSEDLVALFRGEGEDREKRTSLAGLEWRQELITVLSSPLPSPSLATNWKFICDWASGNPDTLTT